jgi:hypothetical protein
MSGVFTILGFVAHLKAIEHDMHELGPAIVAKACKMVCDEAKRVIGEGYDDWAPLKPETLARKMMATPPLETGELRASIEWQSDGLEGAVGSKTIRPFGMNLVRRASRRGHFSSAPPCTWKKGFTKWRLAL